ncbi:MAG TPA: Gfo/Idh/MocA family oxidoreductase [Chloroflexota bacterium]|jgi:predicted dehydrogenase
MRTTSGRTLRVGVIGTGFGATVHVPAFKAAPEFDVVAVVSGHKANAERVAAEHDIGWSGDDYRAMLREVDLDVVSIAVSGGLHHEMALAAAAAGKHILCEKPFAASLTEARDMLAAVRSAGVGHAVNHEFRMNPARQVFRRMVDDGYLGTTFDVRALLDVGMLLNPARTWSWWSDRAQYGGMLQAMTSHLIDFLLWTFGDIDHLSGRLDTFIRSRPTSDGTHKDVTSDDANAALLKFASGASGLIYVTGAARTQRSIVEAHGSEGTLSIDSNRLFAAREPGKLEAVDTPEAQRPVGLMTAYLSHVAQVFGGETDPNVATFEQGVRVQAVMDAIHQSSEAGGSRIQVSK